MEITFLDEALEKFIYSLESQTIAKVLRTIGLLEEFGNKLGMPHSKKVGAGLFELRIRGAQEIRLFYTFQKNKAVLLIGFIKKSNKIPHREIKRALNKLALVDLA